uniref:Cerebellar degeneration-related protein 2a n=1 Tax=Neogobius melanostomus TaxID=47308 RepID=A0A8C6TM63_9GOBI
MLTDLILEEDFAKDGERWYKSHDLERDLHLAAELGKTLLDQNHELEQALQHMYSTNQEQLHEIEYLTKQVDLLRQTNDHHAKLYEQLDVAARDLEQGNQRLVQDNRLAQQKIRSLTEITDSLQSRMEELQAQVEELKMSQADRNRHEAEHRRSLGAQSVSCLKELYDLQDNRHNHNFPTEGLWSHQIFHLNQKLNPDPEEEYRDLQRSIQTLHTQIAVERSYREAAEREIELTAIENRSLEEQLALMDGCRARKQELEAEVERLRCLWQRDCANKRAEQLMLPDAVFFASEEKPGSEDSETQATEQHRQMSRQRRNSDSVLRPTDEIRLGHDRTCIRRTQLVTQRGMSLLYEVDAQYSALQVKYEELLLRCKKTSDRLTHTAVQTSTSPFVSSRARRRLSDLSVVCEEAQPEYKALFKELFTCIQKTREDMDNNRLPKRVTSK